MASLPIQTAMSNSSATRRNTGRKLRNQPHLSGEPAATPQEDLVLDSDECVQGVWRHVYVVAGGLFVVLAAIGIVLPGVPTTPFLLLASFFLSRSFPRLNRLLTDNPIFGPILHNWKMHRGVTQRTKIQALVLIGFAMAFICWAGYSWTYTAMLLALTGIGLCVVCRLPTVS